MCFVFIWEQTATCATYSIIWLVFITQTKSVYCAVRTGSLNKAVCASYLKGQPKLATRYLQRSNRTDEGIQRQEFGSHYRWKGIRDQSWTRRRRKWGRSNWRGLRSDRRRKKRNENKKKNKKGHHLHWHWHCHIKVLQSCRINVKSLSGKLITLLPSFSAQICCYIPCTVHSVNCTVHSTQYTAHSTQYIVHSTQYTVHRTHYTVQIAQYTVHIEQWTVHSAPYTVKSTQYTV